MYKDSLITSITPVAAAGLRIRIAAQKDELRFRGQRKFSSRMQLEVGGDTL
jgi:hypothetical protein